MKHLQMLLWSCALFAGFVARAAEPAPDIDQKLAELKAANEQMAKQFAALQEEVAKLKGAPPAAAAAPAVPPGRIDLGGGFSLKLKGDVRLRYEGMRNTFDLNDSVEDDWGSVRLRTRLGFDVDYDATVGAYVQLTNEYRWGTKTEYNYTVFPWADALNLLVDNAYIRLDTEKLPGKLPLLVTAGRQDLLANPELGWRGMYGEGWILFEGTPYDGSTTISFDAVKVRFTGLEKSTIDFIYAMPSDVEEAANPQLRYSSADQDEDLYALYGISRLTAPVQTELYVMNRNKNRDATVAGKEDPELNTTAFGGRLSSTESLLDGHLDWAAEGAYQTGNLHPNAAIGRDGDYAGRHVDRDAFGAYGKLVLNAKKELPDLNPVATVRFDYLSGDDPDTDGTYEGWDSFYAEWPKWSELMIYKLWDGFGGLTQNPNLGAFTNMYFPSIDLAISPSAIAGLTVRGTYSYLLAAEKNAGEIAGFTGGDGREIGNLFQFLLEYPFTKAIRSHFLFEYLDTGDYYEPNDDAWFARVELYFIF